MEPTLESPVVTSPLESFSSQIPAYGNYPQRRADVSVRVIEGVSVVLDRRAGLIHQLNQTASYIWQRCDGTCTMATLAHRLSQDFAVDPATAMRDVAAILAQLGELNLLQAHGQ